MYSYLVCLTATVITNNSKGQQIFIVRKVIKTEVGKAVAQLSCKITFMYVIFDTLDESSTFMHIHEG